MKATKLFILLFILYTRLYSQEHKTAWSRILGVPKIKNKTYINYNFDFYNTFNFNLEPQFGGLFDTYFKKVKGISNLHRIFDDPSFGYNLIIDEKLGRNLNLKTIYSLGVLKFGDSDSLKVSGYCLKISLNYHF